MNDVLVRLTVLRGMLKCEMLGMKRSRGPSAQSILRKVYKLNGKREEVMVQLDAMIERIKVHQ